MSREIMQQYLARLGSGGGPASWQTLCELVTRHTQTIPFENLDVLAGLQAPLTTAGVLHKVVVRRRGGFCYELNEAFGALLLHLGFTVRRIEARVWAPPRQRYGAPFDHLALVVSLPEGEFLTDVGFGDNNRLPLRLPAAEVTDVSGHYTLRHSAADLWLLSRPDRPLYAMTLAEQPLAAFVPMYTYHRTSPESLFAKGVICTRATATGRITVSQDRLIVVDGAQRTESAIVDRHAVLEQHFGLREAETC